MIPVGDDRVALQRGLRQLVVGGAGVVSLAQRLVALLDASRTAEEVVETFDPDERDAAAELLTALAERHLVTARPEVDQVWAADDPQVRFYREFTSSPEDVRQRLGASHVVVVGQNLLSGSLLGRLDGVGLGAVTVVGHAGLDSGGRGHLDGVERGWGAATPVDGSTPRCVLRRASLEELEGESWSLVIATSDFGEADALLDVNRFALRARRPFLPMWIANMVGFVGPLTHPFETACLRCYRLRVDANDAHRQLKGSIRADLALSDPVNRPVSVIPPMVDALAAVAAMEVVKMLGAFVPSDAVGRSIELNLVSFHSAVRRVLKVPRCPDCSPVMDSAAVALTRGPGLPQP